MGTNYYWYEDECDKCHRTSDPLHIGKSSGGWCFSLRVYQENEYIKGPKDLSEWVKKWNNGGVIKNEYGDNITPEDMCDIITNRKGREKRFETVPYGSSSWDGFHHRNQSEFGPNDLLRHRIGEHCIGHGEGTWDLMVGEFS